MLASKKRDYDERILIVEDNKTLAKLLATKLLKTLPFEIDIAYTLKEAKALAQQYEYFVALLDINLPDAPNGEVVDYMIAHKVPSIVLSGIMDRNFRQTILQKNVIDYVGKGDIKDIDVVNALLHRLSLNRRHKIMIVDDSVVFRTEMSRVLELLQFEVVALGSAEEAINTIENEQNFKIILVDYEMQGMNGFELTKELRKTYSKDDIAIIAISSIDDPDVSAMFLKYGASDFIRKPYIREEFICRINNSIDAIENIDKLKKSSHRDPQTGLYQRDAFLSLSKAYFDKTIDLSSKFSISLFSIDDYEGIKEGYGETMAEAAVIRLASVIGANVSDLDICARYGENEFIVLLKNVSSVETELLVKQIQNRFGMYPIEFLDGSELPLTCSAGVKLTPEHGVEETIDCADMMLFEALNTGCKQAVKYEA